MRVFVGANGAPFYVNSDALMKSVEDKTAVVAQYGSVPYGAGLANGVFTKHRIRRVSLSRPGPKDHHPDMSRGISPDVPRDASPDLQPGTSHLQRSEHEITEKKFPEVDLQPVIVPTGITLFAVLYRYIYNFFPAH